jgi:hypothetical protein
VSELTTKIEAQISGVKKMLGLYRLTGQKQVTLSIDMLTSTIEMIDQLLAEMKQLERRKG